MTADRDAHFGMLTGISYFNTGFTTILGESLRYVHKVIETDGGLSYSTFGAGIVLRRTSKARHEIVATINDDTRGISTLTIQKFNGGERPHERTHFSFVGGEIRQLIEFLTVTIPSAKLEGQQKVRIADRDIVAVHASTPELRRLLRENPDLLFEMASNQITTRDVVALGYRKKELAHFERLLNEPGFFQSEKEAAKLRGDEAVWQAFFERNKWIFGYGLTYLFLDGLDEGKLERAVSGFDIQSAGKRVDGLMKTRALVSSLCFIEIKTHYTALLERSTYRSEIWAPTKELSGGVAQIQGSVQAAIDTLGSHFGMTNDGGDPTGETLFNIAPRSFLVIGSLGEFATEQGPNTKRFQAFELYRRNMLRPEIITFDELYGRAKFIIDHAPVVPPTSAEEPAHDLSF
jgi:hypothetical protein